MLYDRRGFLIAVASLVTATAFTSVTHKACSVPTWKSEEVDWDDVINDVISKRNALIPMYDKYIVTQSADSPDVFGYCDFAIGSFSLSDDMVGASALLIKKGWDWQRTQFDQARWACLFGNGLLDEETAEKMASSVWGRAS